MIQASFVGAWMGYVISYTSSMLTVFSNMVTTLLTMITYMTNAIIWVLVYVVGFPIHLLNLAIAFLSGGTWEVGILEIPFGPYAPLIDGMMEVAPYLVGVTFCIWLLWGKTNMDGELDGAGIPSRTMQVFGWFRDVYKNVYWIIGAMQTKVIQLYNFIKSHIPAMGGTAGEQAVEG